MAEAAATKSETTTKAPAGALKAPVLDKQATNNPIQIARRAWSVLAYFVDVLKRHRLPLVNRGYFLFIRFGVSDLDTVFFFSSTHTQCLKDQSA